MQGLYKFLISIEVISGLLIILLVVSQKSESGGLIAKTSNQFSSTSVSPGVKITRIFVFIFLLNSLCIAVVNNRMQKEVSLLTDDNISEIQDETTPMDN